MSYLSSLCSICCLKDLKNLRVRLQAAILLFVQCHDSNRATRFSHIVLAAKLVHVLLHGRRREWTRNEQIETRPRSLNNYARPQARQVSPIRLYLIHRHRTKRRRCSWEKWVQIGPKCTRFRNRRCLCRSYGFLKSQPRQKCCAKRPRERAINLSLNCGREHLLLFTMLRR